ncbi:hypothetical protein D3C86_1921170 [compost metagenome]
MLGRALAGSDSHRAGGATEQHGGTFCGQLVDIALGLGRARGGIPAGQAQRAAEHTALGVELVDGQQGAAHLGQSFFLIGAGARVVEAEGDRLGGLRTGG